MVVWPPREGGERHAPVHLQLDHDDTPPAAGQRLLRGIEYLQRVDVLAVAGLGVVVHADVPRMCCPAVPVQHCDEVPVGD